MGVARATRGGRNLLYGPEQVGHSHIPGVAGCYLGPLADAWHLRGTEATLEGRGRLYAGHHPDGTADLLPHVSPTRFRPVHQLVFHASKSVDAWLATLTEQDAGRADAAFARAANHTFERFVAPELTARTGRGGTGQVPIDTLAVGFLGRTNAAGYVHQHYHLEIHNFGRSADGRYRCVDNTTLFHRQSFYSLVFQAQLALELYREFGLVVRPTRHHGLEVKGYEPLRGVLTPRQTQVAEYLTQRGLPSTPKTRDIAFERTNAEGKRHPVTPAVARVRTLTWLATVGLHLLQAVRVRVGPDSPLAARHRAERAVSAARKQLDRLGHAVTADQFLALALVEAARRQADQSLVRTEVDRWFGSPRGRLIRTPDGHWTTPAIERVRGKWVRELYRLATQPLTPASAEAVQRVAPPTARSAWATAAVSALGQRAVTDDGVSRPVRLLLDIYRHDRRHVVVVGDPAQQAELAQLGEPVLTPADFASGLRQIGRAKVLTSRPIRREVNEDGQASPLNPRDVIVLDARGPASFHDLLTIVRAARRAGSTVICLTPPEWAVIDRSPVQSPER